MVSAYAATDKIQTGQAGITFDKAFLLSIKAEMSFERIVKIVGVPPVKAAEASLKIPGEKYHWNGREKSSFNIRVSSGKVIDANVVTPDGRIVTLERGELFEIGK
jgi:hypothetical protein